MGQNASSRRALGWLWPMLPPVVPLLGAAVILQFLDPPNLSPDAFAEPFLAGVKAKELFARHLGGRMTYSAVVFFHVVVCLGAMAYYWDRLRETPKTVKQSAYMAIVIEATLVLGALIGLSTAGLAGYKLTYFHIRELIAGTPVGSDLVAPIAHMGFSKLSVGAFLPTGFGVISVIMAAGVASAAARKQPEVSEAEWPQLVRDRLHTLQQSFLILSAVLVTSTLSASLFFHLPTEMFNFEGNSASKEALISYARGLSVFWGAIYTLTLIAVFAPPVVVLLHRLRAFARQKLGKESPSEYQEWLADEHLDFSVRKQLANLAALLAPLMAGQIGSLLQSLGG